MTTQEAFTPTVEGDDALVEIMARAMYLSNPDHFQSTGNVISWDMLMSFKRPAFRDLARAALNALREHGKNKS